MTSEFFRYHWFWNPTKIATYRRPRGAYDIEALKGASKVEGASHESPQNLDFVFLPPNGQSFVNHRKRKHSKLDYNFHTMRTGGEIDRDIFCWKKIWPIFLELLSKPEKLLERLENRRGYVKWVEFRLVKISNAWVQPFGNYSRSPRGLTFFGTPCS